MNQVLNINFIILFCIFATRYSKSMSPYIDIHTHSEPQDATTISSVGIHPWDAEQWRSRAVELNTCGAQAVGEIGLDYACEVDPQIQLRVFVEQLEIAQREQLPVVLHCVRAFEPTMKLLAQQSLPAVIFHGFIGSPQQGKQAVDRGYFLSFGAKSLRSPKTVELIRTMPPERLFLESDCEPIDVRAIYDRVAQIRGCTIDELKERIYTNFIEIFTPNE